MDALIGALTGLGLFGAVVAVGLAGAYAWRLGEAKKEARGKADAEREKQYSAQPFEEEEDPTP